LKCDDEDDGVLIDKKIVIKNDDDINPLALAPTEYF
jgi:hypothetical protein